MGDSWVPDDIFSMEPLIHNFFENTSLVQVILFLVDLVGDTCKLQFFLISGKISLCWHYQVKYISSHQFKSILNSCHFYLNLLYMLFDC